MDPSLRSYLFNRMMQAMELGDKSTADKIESLIRNFRPDSQVPVSVYVPSSEDNFIPNLFPPSSNSDAQTTVDSDVEDHQRDVLHFSPSRPCSFDTEVNVVGEDELHKYKSRFDLPDSVTLMLPGDWAMWNPPENAVAIYEAMLSCGVTLPLQPFIARFLAEAQIAPAQLAPNSYRILMCLCLMWKLKGYGPPTPREIRHFYTLRQVGNGGTYFLLSLPVENWIPEGVANPGQAKKVPRHFTSPEAWSKATPVLLDREVSRLAAAAVLPLSSRDRSFLLDEEKMISEGIFTRLHARLPRLRDFDTVCDLQARAVKNSEAASKRHVAGLAKEGIAGPDGDEPSDGEDAGDVAGGGVESGQPPMRAETAASVPVAAAATTPTTATAATTPAATTSSRKGKEKVGVSGGVSDIPIFDANVPETPLDPTSDLAPRARNKRPAESASDHSARPPKRASRVVQFVVSSNEEDVEEPAVAETPSTQPEGPSEAENVAAPPFEGVNEQTLPASTSPRPASPAVVMGEPSVSDQPRPFGQSESTDRPGRSNQAGTSASGSGLAHEVPLTGPVEADEGNVSLFDFSATEICSHCGEKYRSTRSGSETKKRFSIV
ncbi:hypothetical protein LWI29_022996 [Acer saccharum]|uniref:Uncharacterized protein n=1 Tax=Acer saccharum TaxID=4024 RepID=A0AA39REX5_ACESA|nr:hypothetical protein LWI29_022996 [Acer saccharum]